MVIAAIACCILGPIFFVQDGLSFPDFLCEDNIDTISPDPEQLGILETRLANAGGKLSVAEQPVRHFSYMLFLIPLYCVVLTRVTELLGCVDLFSTVAWYLALMAAVLLLGWLLWPNVFVVWSRHHDCVLVVRQWGCLAQVWGCRASVLKDLDGVLDWTSNRVTLRTRGIHPGAVLTQRSSCYLSPLVLPPPFPWLSAMVAACSRGLREGSGSTPATPFSHNQKYALMHTPV